jgi:hypothetical protein
VTGKRAKRSLCGHMKFFLEIFKILNFEKIVLNESVPRRELRSGFETGLRNGGLIAFPKAFFNN